MSDWDKIGNSAYENAINLQKWCAKVEANKDKVFNRKAKLDMTIIKLSKKEVAWLRLWLNKKTIAKHIPQDVYDSLLGRDLITTSKTIRSIANKLAVIANERKLTTGIELPRYEIEEQYNKIRERDNPNKKNEGRYSIGFVEILVLKDKNYTEAFNYNTICERLFTKGYMDERRNATQLGKAMMEAVDLLYKDYKKCCYKIPKSVAHKIMESYK